MVSQQCKWVFTGGTPRRLLQVSAVYTGSSERAKELATTMPGASLHMFATRYPQLQLWQLLEGICNMLTLLMFLAVAGLDASCAVVDLADGRRGRG